MRYRENAVDYTKEMGLPSHVTQKHVHTYIHTYIHTLLDATRTTQRNGSLERACALVSSRLVCLPGPPKAEDTTSRYVLARWCF